MNCVCVSVLLQAREAPLSSSPLDDVEYEGADKVNDEDSEKGEGAIGTVPSADGKSSDLDGGDRGDTTPGGVSDSDVPKAESEPSTVPVDEDMRKDSVGDVDGVREIVDDAPVSEDVAPVSEDGVLRPVDVVDVDDVGPAERDDGVGSSANVRGV